jgi:hypothetical protein
VEAAEPLDDPRVLLRDDAKRLRHDDDDDDEERHREDQRSDAHCRYSEIGQHAPRAATGDGPTRRAPTRACRRRTSRRRARRPWSSTSAVHCVPRYCTRAVPSAFHASTVTGWPRSSDACRVGLPCFVRHRLASARPTAERMPPTRSWTGNARADQRDDAAERERDADGQQVERAGRELQADEQRRQQPPDPVIRHLHTIPNERHPQHKAL